MFFNVFYKSEKTCFFYVFYSKINVFIIYAITVLTSLLPHKKFTWTDFVWVYSIYPRRYAPATHMCVHHVSNCLLAGHWMAA